MKPWLKLPALVALSSSLFFVACDPDDTDPLPPAVTNEAPTLSLRNASGSDFSGAVTDVPVNSKFELTVNAADADENLQVIRFQRNDVDIPGTSGFVQYDVDGDGILENIASGNLLITTGGQYSENFFFLASQDFDDEVTYTVTVADEEMEEASIDFTLTTEAEPAPMTPVLDTSGVFFNRDGSMAGAFDLDSARAVSSSSMDSELQDAGINTDLPADENWRKVIIAENGATIYSLSEADMTEFSYDAIGFVEDIRDIRTRAVESNPNAGETRTGSLSEGDVFLVETEDDIYLVEVTTITDTADDNNDGYTISYKFGPKDE